MPWVVVEEPVVIGSLLGFVVAVASRLCRPGYGAPPRPRFSIPDRLGRAGDRRARAARRVPYRPLWSRGRSKPPTSLRRPSTPCCSAPRPWELSAGAMTRPIAISAATRMMPRGRGGRTRRRGRRRRGGRGSAGRWRPGDGAWRDERSPPRAPCLVPTLLADARARVPDVARGGDVLATGGGGPGLLGLVDAHAVGRGGLALAPALGV